MIPDPTKPLPMATLYARTEWISFELEFRGAKTDRWRVLANQGHGSLGQIRWHAHWRRYVFVPASDALLFDATCLQDIATFIDKRMAERG